MEESPFLKKTKQNHNSVLGEALGLAVGRNIPAVEASPLAGTGACLPFSTRAPLGMGDHLSTQDLAGPSSLGARMVEGRLLPGAGWKFSDGLFLSSWDCHAGRQASWQGSSEMPLAEWKVELSCGGGGGGGSAQEPQCCVGGWLLAAHVGPHPLQPKPLKK